MDHHFAKRWGYARPQALDGRWSQPLWEGSLPLTNPTLLALWGSPETAARIPADDRLVSAVALDFGSSEEIWIYTAQGARVAWARSGETRGVWVVARAVQLV